MNYRVKENSLLARMGAWRLGADRVAMVIGRTIHLYNTTREEFLKNDRWVKHELCHIRQFQRYGFIGFILRYSLETIKRGYFMNKYEVEARQAEEAG